MIFIRRAFKRSSFARRSPEERGLSVKRETIGDTYTMLHMASWYGSHFYRLLIYEEATRTTAGTGKEALPSGNK